MPEITRTIASFEGNTSNTHTTNGGMHICILNTGSAPITATLTCSSNGRAYTVTYTVPEFTALEQYENDINTIEITNAGGSQYYITVSA